MEVPRHWRLNRERYSLVGGSCEGCGEKHLPERAVCPDCGTVSSKYSASAERKIERTTTQHSIPVNSSARITSIGLDGSLQDPNSRSTVPYSEIIKNDSLAGADQLPVKPRDALSEANEHIIYNASLISAD